MIITILTIDCSVLPQVQRREKEIERLSCELRGGRPPEALAMEGRIEGDQRMVAHLNIQVCGVCVGVTRG